MNDPQKIREITWRRALTPDEEAAWRAQWPSAEAQADLELESALTEGLKRLPDVPISSNFTARVLQAADREVHLAEKRMSGRRGAWKSIFPRVVFVLSGVLTLAAIATLIVHQNTAQARQMAQSVAAISEVEALPSPEVLQDFEAIRRLNFTPPPDEQLLALFQ